MATKILIRSSRQIGDDRKLVLEETKIIINCLNCTEVIKFSLLISSKENTRRCRLYSFKITLNSVAFLQKYCSAPLGTGQLPST